MTNYFAFPPSQVNKNISVEKFQKYFGQIAREPPDDMCTSWPELKFGVSSHHRGNRGAKEKGAKQTFQIILSFLNAQNTEINAK